MSFHAETIESMYKMIASAIREANIDAHPMDYLNFFCLGNRESDVSGAAQELPADVKPNTTQWRVLQSGRFMVYVHSKMMIVDDEVALVGSANINQRSMDGSRDTEIMLGAWQPAHLANGNRYPEGDVHRFRMTL